MPYLQFVFCDHCKKAPMDIDYKGTIEAYHKDGRRDKNNFINPATIVWDYLVYRCTFCGKAERYKFRDIERKVREHFSEMSEDYREYFDKLGKVDFPDPEQKMHLPKPNKQTDERLIKTYAKE